jgi:hypothetical protein
MNEKSTPGPWKWEHDTEAGLVAIDQPTGLWTEDGDIVAKADIEVDPCSGRLAARINFLNQSCADMQLIAAAPDLLKACELVLASLRTDDGNLADIHVLVTAIAKAAGTQEPTDE